MNNKICSILTLLSGMLCILSYPGSPADELAWVFLSPWLIVVRTANIRTKLLSSLVMSLFYALPCTIDGIYTACRTLSENPFMVVLHTVLFYLPFLTVFLLFGLYSILFKYGGGRGVFSGALVLTAVFYSVPTVFPVTPAIFLYRQTWALQFADIGGMPLVDFLLIFINFSIAQIALSLWKKEFPMWLFLTSAIVSGMIVGYGNFRIHQFRFKPGDTGIRQAVVGFIQPDIPRGAGEMSLVRDNRRQVLSALEMTRRLLAKKPETKLILWPESPVAASCDRSSRVYKKISGFSKEKNVSIIYQCLECSGKQADQTRVECYNAARLVSQTGKNNGLYRKQMPIPFFEGPPTNWFYRMMSHLLTPAPGFIKAGTRGIVFEIPGKLRVLPLICYDVHFPQLTRSASCDIIAVMANNQRFGRSRIGTMDYAMTMFRAVENRKPLVRAANTGPSAIIQATGETVPGSLTPIFSRQYRSSVVYCPQHRTVYSKVGDLCLKIIRISALLSFIIRILFLKKMFIICRRRPGYG